MTLDVTLDEMVDGLRRLVEIESPSDDLAGCAAALDALAELSRGLFDAPIQRVDQDGQPLLRIGPERPAVLLVGHMDTVWPVGTLAARPFTVTDGIGRGPGCFDMKAGFIQAIHALAGLSAAERSQVGLLATTDEESGSLASRPVIEAMAGGARAVLVLEPSADGGALKVARKGVSTVELVVTGRAAHAGLEPEKGANALIELAHQVIAAHELSRPAAGTTVSPTVAVAGSVVNVIAERASALVDIRVTDVDEHERVRAGLRALTPRVEGTEVAVVELTSRPPMPESAAAALYERAVAAAQRLGQQPPAGVAVGGGSDGNFTAALGIPTLDGLGAVGGGAHAADEHVIIAAMPERAALLRDLIADLLGDDQAGVEAPSRS